MVGEPQALGKENQLYLTNVDVAISILWEILNDKKVAFLHSILLVLLSWDYLVQITSGNQLFANLHLSANELAEKFITSLAHEVINSLENKPQKTSNDEKQSNLIPGQ